MTEGRAEQRALAEALIDACCAAHSLDLTAGDREIVVNNVRALIDAFRAVYAFPLPEGIEPANTFRASP